LMNLPIQGLQPIGATLHALEHCLAELSGERALLAAAHLESAILALRSEMIARGIEPDTDQSIGAPA
jgi:hypothetical protein